MRTKAREWLTAEHGRFRNGKGVDLVKVKEEWLTNDDLATVRDEPALARLSEVERQAWRALWAEVNPKDQTVLLAQARAHVDRKEWAQAADTYTRVLKDKRLLNSEAWFEYAAVQLLSGDRAGYGQTCKFLVKDGPKNRLRSYLIARACTLASDPAVDVLKQAAVASGLELKGNPRSFWSLTEQGALWYRTKQFKKALPEFQASLRAEPQLGAAVLNWLWLALTCHRLGEGDDARSWLNKAAGYLDGVGAERPSDADAAGLHRHNWLEAHVLRREAEALLPAK
jgi:tetratricopeptide (TPR) repeat protein